MAQSKSYKFKKGDAGEDLEALVYYKPDQSGGEKPIGENSFQTECRAIVDQLVKSPLFPWR